MMSRHAVRSRAKSATLLVTVVIACLAASGCLTDANDNSPDTGKPKNDPNDPSEPNEPTCTVQFVNTSPYDATVVYYIGTEDHRFESLLLRDGTRKRDAVVPEGHKDVTDPIPCSQIESIMIAEARFDLGAGLSATGSTAIFLQGEDYLCEDTLRFYIDYRIHPDELTIQLVIPPDCNKNGIPDDEDMKNGTAADCNENGVPDECDIASGDAVDENGDGIPDECAQE